MEAVCVCVPVCVKVITKVRTSPGFTLGNGFA